MVWKNWQQKKNQILSFATLKEPFRILTISLLSLLLPLSFLLLARLSSAHFLLTFTSYSPSQPFSFLFSLFLCTNPPLLHALVSIVSISTLIYGLTGKIPLLNQSPNPILRPRLYTAWIFLCTLQVCVGLGIEGSIADGIDGWKFGGERSLFSRVIFFLGLHETMLHFSRIVVKPVVDDTVFGEAREERWVEKAAMAAVFGGLWWWRLRDEVESLVMVAETKKLLMGLGVPDFVGWWLYYLTVTIGMVKVVKGFMWVCMVLVCKRGRGNSGETCGEDDKV